MAKKKELLVLRGKDELDFMASRAESTPISSAVARTQLAQLRSRLESLERHEGREMHEVGTTLLSLYMRHADATLGYRSFRGFLEAQFAGDPRRAYEAMAVARASTEKLASSKGAKWVLRAWTWARQQGHDDLARAAQLSVNVGDREVPLLETSVRQLDEAIGRASQPVLPEPAGRQLVKARKKVLDLTRRDPDAAALAPTVYLEEGRVRVRVAASGPNDLAAVKRVLAAAFFR